jgi:N-glycosylase/DNA lyase
LNKYELQHDYQYWKLSILNRLSDFSNTWKTSSNKKLFQELCFCLLTPQSKARLCWRAVTELSKKELLLNGDAIQVRNVLFGVRFKNKKAFYIVNARRYLNIIKQQLHNHNDVLKLRMWLFRNIKGLGLKESSHFLRNVGLGENIAILDRHILRNLQKAGVIESVPKSLSVKKYLAIEEKMKFFSSYVNIPMSHLDLLLWAEETGDIFK